MHGQVGPQKCGWRGRAFWFRSQNLGREGGTGRDELLRTLDQPLLCNYFLLAVEVVHLSRCSTGLGG